MVEWPKTHQFNLNIKKIYIPNIQIYIPKDKMIMQNTQQKNFLNNFFILKIKNNYKSIMKKMNNSIKNGQRIKISI